MSQLVRDNIKPAVILIDVSKLENDIVADCVRNMQAVLVYANREELPVYLVELSPSGSQQHPDERTAIQLRGLLSPNIPVIRKPRFNAFDDTDLLKQLHSRAVNSHVVLMGQEANCCVKQTALGGVYRRRGGTFIDGAVGHGYSVLTSDVVLRANFPGGPSGIKADWWADPRVEYYSML
ncbi:cysteine hydrolase family protein [Enterobacter mori]|uniref:cysteine hydrolase family protein n=1 Tax=Enterobacter mori TaxID=539813 RepID=UPI003B844347